MLHVNVTQVKIKESKFFDRNIAHLMLVFNVLEIFFNLEF